MKKNQRKKVRDKKLKTFNENAAFLSDGNIFGLPFSPEESEVVIIPCSWDVTVSFREGTADGPQAVLDSSSQIDLYDEAYPDLWKKGISVYNPKTSWRKLSRLLRKDARFCLKYLENKTEIPLEPKLKEKWDRINRASSDFNQWLEKESLRFLDNNQIVGALGGEHSISFGLIKALARKHQSFGILQIDAHLDLRQAFCGFRFSHASAMNNTLSIPQVKKITHVGVRDFCTEEIDLSRKSKKRSEIFSDRYIQKEKFEGKNWKSICQKIIKTLPKSVYISFDIDGLKPYLCPNTGTPVPGGLEFSESAYLLEEIVRSGRKIIGFDLCEVAPASLDRKTWPEDWNAIVGGRVLYKLALAALKSQN